MNPWVVTVGENSIELYEDPTQDVYLSAAPDISYNRDAPTYPIPGEDGSRPGVDREDGMLVTFSLSLGDFATEAGSRAILDRLRQVWRGKGVRRTAGAVGKLTAPSGVVTFGRPNRYAVDLTDQKAGFIRATVDFEATADLWYSADTHRLEVPLQPPLGGGLKAPLTTPLTTTYPANRSQQISVGGVEDVWPTYEIRGPIIDPVIEVVGLFRLKYRGTLKYDNVLRIVTLPQQRLVTVDGAATSLSPTSDRVGKAFIPRGTYEVVLRGTSSSGTALMTIEWLTALTNY